MDGQGQVQVAVRPDTGEVAAWDGDTQVELTQDTATAAIGALMANVAARPDFDPIAFQSALMAPFGVGANGSADYGTPEVRELGEAPTVPGWDEPHPMGKGTDEASQSEQTA